MALGISTPTREVPGIGASIRTLATERLRASSLSRAKILERLTPAGGFRVYCVTRGPIFAPSISTSIPKSARVDLIMKAFCWTLPGSAGEETFSSKSIGGIFQFGSPTESVARSVAFSAFGAVVAFPAAPFLIESLRRRPKRFLGFFSSTFLVSPEIFSSVFLVDSAFSASVGAFFLPSLLEALEKASMGEICKTKIPVTKINRA